MITESRIQKLETEYRKSAGGADVIGVTFIGSDEVTTNGVTITRAEWERLYPDGTLIIWRYGSE